MSPRSRSRALRWAGAAAIVLAAGIPFGCVNGCEDAPIQPRTYPSRAPGQTPHQDPEYFAPPAEPEGRDADRPTPVR